ncbi:MAG: hypothetical protein NTV30_10580, partial [Chloroflexi bacterium]|nr:hypothetical protein [Chloroflexota bacterium]
MLQWRNLSEGEWKKKVLAEDDDIGRLIAASGYPGNKFFRRILEYVLTALEARTCALIIWFPLSHNELAQVLDLDELHVKEILYSLHIKGLIYPREVKTMEGCRYRLSTGKLHKSMLLNPEISIKYPDLPRLWDDFVNHEEGEWQCISTIRAYDENQPVQRRILPAWKALVKSQDRDQIQPWEDQRVIAESVELAVEIPCSCRVQIKGSGSVCNRTKLSACFVFNNEAEYYLSKGIGKKVSRVELLGIMERASLDGLAGSYENSRSVKASALCYCCDCCCHLWVALKQHKIPDKYRGWAKSRWQPVIDQLLCSGCSDKPLCINKCAWNAIKLEEVNGKQVVFINSDLCWGCGSCV